MGISGMATQLWMQKSTFPFSMLHVPTLTVTISAQGDGFSVYILSFCVCLTVSVWLTEQTTLECGVRPGIGLENYMWHDIIIFSRHHRQKKIEMIEMPCMQRTKHHGSIQRPMINAIINSRVNILDSVLYRGYGGYREKSAWIYQVIAFWNTLELIWRRLIQGLKELVEQIPRWIWSIGQQYKLEWAPSRESIARWVCCKLEWKVVS